MFNFSTPDGSNSEICSSTTVEGANRNAESDAQSANRLMNNAQIADRMKCLFESSLKLHLTGQYMKVRITDLKKNNYLIAYIKVMN